MTRRRVFDLPLLVRLGVALLVAALLPVGISFYQLRSNRDALKDQVLRTHLVASSSAAERVAGAVRSVDAIASSLAESPLLLDDPRGPAAQELVRGTLFARPDVAALGLYDPAGETVIAARRSDLAVELEPLPAAAAGGPRLEVVQGLERPWLRVRAPVAGDAGVLEVVASAEAIAEAVASHELGEEATLLLADPAGREIAGEGTLADYPAELLEQARSGALESGARTWNEAGLVVGHESVAGTDWFVLSRQPAAVAEVAQAGIRRATRIAGVGTIALTALLSSMIHLSVVQPIRRVVAAQRRLVGLGAGGGGSEIAQLEEAFERLAERVRRSDELGEVFLGRYQVVELLGSGAMGTVFRGWDPSLQRHLAIKTLQVEGESEEDRVELAAQLVEEAITSARFNHPNIVTVYDVAAQGGAAFIAMELVEGQSLEAHLRSRGPLDAATTIEVGRAMCRALGAAHESDLVHHDVKPGNVLIGTDGSIKLTDFGISEILSTASRGSGRICGTPGYLPPEALEDGRYTPQSDLFSLGAVLYRCLTGREAYWNGDFRETIVRTLAGPPPSARESAPETPVALARLLGRLMAREPADRPGSAGEVLAELDAIAAAEDLGPGHGLEGSRHAGPERSTVCSRLVTVVSAEEARTRPVPPTLPAEDRGGDPSSGAPRS